ncbi:hypothetical protein NQ317_006580 [Molorchus minor]|uniref:Uncharacterized protein n=1 Tax=Molorchus minor TaxID=1323400 RepID=A0ABQ9K0K7_9CUCU|nr:hypothetical protein NQ317_006580 [Molorchus minor]
MITDGKSYQSIMDFMNYISRKADIFEQFECDGYLRYYLVCIRPEYRKKRTLNLPDASVSRNPNTPTEMSTKILTPNPKRETATMGK